MRVEDAVTAASSLPVAFGGGAGRLHHAGRHGRVAAAAAGQAAA